MTDPNQLDEQVRRISNWGRWGDEDERGTLNHIGPEACIAAARGVTRGLVVSCARPIPDRTTAAAEHRFLRHTVRSGADAPERGYGWAEEWIGLHVHGHDMTHLDAPAHVFWNRRSYNGRDASTVTGAHGAAANAVTAAATGLVGRGVLLDLAPTTPLEPGTAITPADLEECERRQGLECGVGDLVFVRTGRDARAEMAGRVDPAAEGSPGLSLDCADWFADRGISLLGTDVVAEARAATDTVLPAFHVLTLVALGLWLVDNLALEALARTCRQEGRWHYLAVLAPLPLLAATGSPVNPLAVF
jgi:kynurenine formamidase